jgi:hypothetical protein
MAPDTDPIQFPRQIWQTVSEQARCCLANKDFCPEQSRIENLRCVRFELEKETVYGSQIWFFEAIGVDYSVEYGLMELKEASVYEDSEQRQKLMSTDAPSLSISVWHHASTRFWVRTACLGVVVTSMMWLTMLFSYLSNRP